MGAHPQAEACQIRCHGRHAVGRAFLWRIAPRLIPGGEDAHVAAGEHVVVAQVEEAVVAVELGRVKDDGHLAVRRVCEPQALAAAQDGVAVRIVQVVGGNPVLRSLRPCIGITADCSLVYAVVAAHDGAYGQDVRQVLVLLGIDAGKGFQEDVYALVDKFIAP